MEFLLSFFGKVIEAAVILVLKDQMSERLDRLKKQQQCKKPLRIANGTRVVNLI